MLRMLLGAALVAAAFAGDAFAAAERIMILETERFTIQRVTYPPGERQAALHPPPGTGQIVTMITPGDVEVEFSENGKTWTEKGKVAPGKVWWLSPTTLHKYANGGDAPFTFTVVTFR